MNNPKSRSGSNAGSGDAWFLRKGGKQYGPFTIRRLREFVDAGKVKPTTQASRDGRRWIPASDVPGLFPEVVPAEGIDFGPEPEPTPMEGFAGCDEFIIVRNGRESTPVKFEKLQRLAQAGGLRPDDELLQELNGFRMSLGLAKEQDWFPGYEPPPQVSLNHAAAKSPRPTRRRITLALWSTIGGVAMAGLIVAGIRMNASWRDDDASSDLTTQAEAFENTESSAPLSSSTLSPQASLLASRAKQVIAAEQRLREAAGNSDPLAWPIAKLEYAKAFIALVEDPQMAEWVRSDEWLDWRPAVDKAVKSELYAPDRTQSDHSSAMDAIAAAGRKDEYVKTIQRWPRVFAGAYTTYSELAVMPDFPGAAELYRLLINKDSRQWIETRSSMGVEERRYFRDSLDGFAKLLRRFKPSDPSVREKWIEEELPHDFPGTFGAVLRLADGGDEPQLAAFRKSVEALNSAMRHADDVVLRARFGICVDLLNWLGKHQPGGPWGTVKRYEPVVRSLISLVEDPELLRRLTNTSDASERENISFLFEACKGLATHVTFTFAIIAEPNESKERTCAWCGRAYVGDALNGGFCSPKCKVEKGKLVPKDILKIG